MKRPDLGDRNRVHNHNIRGKRSHTYTSWSCMKYRCSGKNCRDFHNYGGRGITFDPRWENFSAFLEDMGEAPEKFTLERINNELGYSKDNCRWASKREQCRNTRRNHIVEFRGEKKLLIDWAEQTGISIYRLSNRLNNLGWSVERALTEGVNCAH